MYVEGLHVTKDIKLAHQYFQKSADDVSTHCICHVKIKNFVIQDFLLSFL